MTTESKANETTQNIDLAITTPVNLIATGTAAWFEANVNSMSLTVLRRKYDDFEGQLIAYERGNLPLTKFDRMEICAAQRVIEERMDELLPKIPQSIDAHDKVTGCRSQNNWPQEFHRSTLIVHLHLCELLFAWRLRPEGKHADKVSVDEYAETLGRSRFIFGSKSDAGDFIDHYGLEDFVLTEPKATGQTESTPDGKSVTVFYFVEFTNKFHRDDVNDFIRAYNLHLLNLSVVYEERRRAVSIENGKFGYVHADHFSEREVHELNAIRAAREKLGVGFRLLNQLASQGGASEQ